VGVVQEHLGVFFEKALDLLVKCAERVSTKAVELQLVAQPGRAVGCRAPTGGREEELIEACAL